MHEISVLKRAVDLAEQTAIDNNIDRIAYITLEVGELSGYLPVFFEKYFDVVIEDRPIFEGAELKMIRPRGEGLCLDCHAMYNVMDGIGFGPMINFNTYASIKTRYKKDGGKFKEMEKDIHQRKVTFDWMGIVYTPGPDFYIKYSPNDVLKEGSVKFRSLTFGLYI